VAISEANPAPLSVSRSAETSPPQDGVLAAEHVASFGRELVGKHLISMQAAGALMLAALVGAVAIVAHGQQNKHTPRRHGGMEKGKSE